MKIWIVDATDQSCVSAFWTKESAEEYATYLKEEDEKSDYSIDAPGFMGILEVEVH